MQDRIASSPRRPLRWTLLPVVATIGVLAGLPAAFAFDQQATDDELDNSINWQAATSGTYGPSYAQAPDHGLVYAPRHRTYTYR
jgi:hypothetical protein